MTDEAATNPVRPRLAGRVAWITGGGRGIGRGTALLLARLGARVAVLARSPEEVSRVAREIRDSGGQAVPIAADVSEHEAVRSAVRRIEAEAGPVDILVNAAGVMPLGPLVTGDPAEWRYAIEVNLIGAYECMRAVLPGMLARGWGRVVNVSSVVATMPGILNRSAYVVSKAALDRLTVAAAGEVAGSGATVNTVYPGVTDTAMQAQLREAPEEVIGKRQRDFVRDAFARGQFHTPQEIGRLIVAVVLGDLNGAIVGVDDERGRELLGGLPA